MKSVKIFHQTRNLSGTVTNTFRSKYNNFTFAIKKEFKNKIEKIKIKAKLKIIKHCLSEM